MASGIFSTDVPGARLVASHSQRVSDDSGPIQSTYRVTVSTEGGCDGAASQDAGGGDVLRLAGPQDDTGPAAPLVAAGMGVAV